MNPGRGFGLDPGRQANRMPAAVVASQDLALGVSQPINLRKQWNDDTLLFLWL